MIKRRIWRLPYQGFHQGTWGWGARPNRCTLGKPEFNQILTHFLPRAKQRHKMSALAQDAEIDILIATDCISEGQNLQDCDLLVNYDIH